MNHLKSISWILEFTSKLSEEEQVKCLQANDNNSIKAVLKFCFDPNIEWLLPEDNPPYTPCDLDRQENMLYREAMKLHYYVRGGYDNLNQVKRERMYIEMLESITPEDAILMLSIKNKKLPWDIKPETVLLAFPNLF